MSGAPSNEPCLTVLGGPMSGTQLVIEDAVDDILIGSDPSCTLCIPLPGVSPVHARIWLDASGATVHDTHSPRGLYVNDDRVNAKAPLKNGDILWLGTPGEDAVVMIQCRLPRPTAVGPPVTLAGAEASPPALSELYVEAPAEAAAEPARREPAMEATMVLGDSLADPQPAPPPPLFAPAPDAATVFEDETLATAPTPSPAPAPPSAAATTPITAPAPTPRPPEPTPVPAPKAPAAAAEAARGRSRPSPPSRPTARPAPAAARPAPAPASEPRPEPRLTPPAARGIALAAALLALVGVGGFFAWRWLGPTRTALVTPTPAPAPATAPRATLAPAEPRPPAAQTPAPAPPIEEAVTIVRSPSPRAPSPSPSGAKPSPSPKGAATPAPVATPAGPSAEELRAQQVAGLLGQAESAAARPDEALRLYDEALKLDPQNARAVAGRTAAQAAVAASRKRFAAARTLVQGGKAKADLSGFDSADVQVSDAPGRIDFELAPASVKPGDGYTVRIFFLNDAKRTIKVRSLSVGTMTNGARSGGPVTPRVREIAPQQRALIAELSGVWKDGTASWTLDVVLVSDRNDTYRNQVSWK